MDDAGRALVDSGSREVERVLGRCLSRMDNKTLTLWTSPYRRARETAAIAARQLQLIVSEQTELLVPEASPTQLLERLYQASQTQPTDILLTSHQPLVSSLLDLLCGPAGPAHYLKTGSLACIECEFPAAGLAHLAWLEHP